MNDKITLNISPEKGRTLKRDQGKKGKEKKKNARR